MQVRGVELSQAIKELAEMAGLTLVSHQTAYKAASAPYKANITPITPPEPPREPLGAYSDIYEELYFISGGLDQESRAYLTGAI
jgi:hypothetical protein